MAFNRFSLDEALRRRAAAVTSEPTPVVSPSWLDQHGRDRAGVPVFADTDGLASLASALKYAVSKQVFLAAQQEIVEVAQVVVEDAKGRVSYSTRIPPTIQARRTRGLQVIVSAGGPSAPHATPIENHGEGYVRHPWWGVWGSEPAKGSHPAYLHPAMDAHRAELDARLQVVTERATQRVLDEAPDFLEPRSEPI